MITPCFTSNYSLSKSILTLEDSESPINEAKPVSIFSIAKENKLDKIFLNETSFSSFIAFYKGCEKEKIQGVFGITLIVVTDQEKKDEDSFKTESKITIWMKNSSGYKPLIKIFSEAATNGFYYIPRISWKRLNELWDDSLWLTIPFYSSFLAENLLNYNHRSIPEFRVIKPVFLIEEHNLPFDGLITKIVEKFCHNDSYKMEKTHSIFYHKNVDVLPYQIYKTIFKRSVINNPNLSHFSSDQFSWESYLQKYGSTSSSI